MTKLNEELKISIFNHGSEAAMDISELTIDAFMDEGVFKEIPIVKSVYSMYRLGTSVKSIHFSRKLVAFLESYNRGEISDEELNRMQNKMDSDIKFESKVLEHVMVSVDRFNSVHKSQIYANLFRNYINSVYSWNSFVDLTMCIENLMVSDYELFRKLSNTSEPIKIEEIEFDEFDRSVLKGSVERLKNYGFLDFTTDTWDALSDYFKKKVFLTEYGLDFYRMCICM